jgi:hypothetical protein
MTPPDPRTAEERLRAAAFLLVTATDNLAHWDRDHGYVINSERDYLDGVVSDAWTDLRAALAAEPVPVPLDVEWGQVQAAFTNMVAVRDAPVLDDEFWMAVRAEYDRLATPPEPEP